VTDTSKDDGLIVVLAERLETQRLPRALSLKEKVDAGGILNEFDISFLEEVIEDVRKIHPLVERAPEWQPVVTKMLNLYNEIAAQAVENEKTR
jgi:hypothetical protein